MATSQKRAFGVEIDSLTGLHWLGILLAAITGVIHIFLGVSFISSSLGVPFLLAGLGFFGAIALVLLDIRRRAVYALGVPFTAIQLVLWYYFNFAVGPKSFPGEIGAMGAVDKIAQIVLILVLIVLLRGE